MLKATPEYIWQVVSEKVLNSFPSSNSTLNEVDILDRQRLTLCTGRTSTVNGHRTEVLVICTINSDKKALINNTNNFNRANHGYIS